MPASGPQRPETVDWVRRVNNRWIVHLGLKESAQAYLDHLQANDPERLTRSCEHARQLVGACDPCDDPKPWFYAGLFSLVSLEEAARFLSGHWFTACCIPTLPAAFGERMQPEDVGAETKAKLMHIRESLAAGLSRPSTGRTERQGPFDVRG